MRDGSKSCPHCGSRFTFESYELVDSMPADVPCEGCERLYAILAESARRKAAKAQQETQPEVMDDLSPSAILSRLLGNRRRASEPEHDPRMAAAGKDAD